MNTPPANLGDRDVRQALAAGWALRAADIQYVPKGFGTHHWLAHAQDGARYFVNVDDLDSKPWLGADRRATRAGLAAAFATAIALRDEAGLPFVVAPLPSSQGHPLEPLADRYAISLFPFVDGVGAGYADGMSLEDRETLFRLLAALHAAAVTARPPRREPEIPGRADLQAALAALRLPWTAGPFSELARAELARHADTVRHHLADFDDLARRAGGGPLVVTHGEPHPGNILRAADGLRLVDWDTVALARPERDLWMLDDGSPDAFAAYTAAGGPSPDPAAIALHRLAWPLTDVALFTATLRSPHTENADTRLAWKSLRDTLAHLAAMHPDA